MSSPYYDKVDKLIGVFGTKEGFTNENRMAFSCPPPKPRLHENFNKKRNKGTKSKLITMIPLDISDAWLGPIN